MRRHMANLMNEFDRTSSQFFNDPLWKSPLLREDPFFTPSLSRASIPLIDDFFDTTMYDINQLPLPAPSDTSAPVVNAQGRTEEEQKGDTALTTVAPQHLSLWHPQSSLNLRPITVNVVEKEKEYLISADLPGVDKNDVKLSVHDGVLSIAAERRQSSELQSDTTPPTIKSQQGQQQQLSQQQQQQQQQQMQKESFGLGGKYRRIEHQFGQVTRSFKLPGNVDVSKLSAKFDNGVLHITLPKTAEAAAKPIEVKIQ